MFIVPKRRLEQSVYAILSVGDDAVGALPKQPITKEAADHSVHGEAPQRGMPSMYLDRHGSVDRLVLGCWVLQDPNL